MFAWWWLVIMLFIGVFMGIILMGLCCANRSDLENARKWDDDEQRE